MAKQRRVLADFDTFESKTQSGNNTEPSNGSAKLNSNTEPSNDSAKLNSNTEPSNDSAKLNKSIESASVSPSMQADFVSRYYEEVETQSRARVEDTHTRDTFLIQNDLLKRLNDLAAIEKKKGNKGFKKRLINYLLEQELPNLEKKLLGRELS
ncbi:hypothetical protein KM868_09600 [Micrococcus luteus]|nr:hypothetical protein [Micrococcus luteus]